MSTEHGESQRAREHAERVYNYRLAKIVDFTILQAGMHIPDDTFTLKFLFTEAHAADPAEGILGKDDSSRNADAAKMYGERLAGRIMQVPEGGRYGLPYAGIEQLTEIDRAVFKGMSTIIAAEIIYRAQVQGYSINLPSKG